MFVPMSPTRILRRAAKLYPRKIALIDGPVRWTYAQVHERANQVTDAVQQLGVPSGGRVAVLDYNSYRYMELYFGMAQSGRVLLPLNTRLSADEYAYILNDAEAEAIIFQADFKPVMAKVKERVKTVKHFFIAEGPADEAWISGTYEALIDQASPEPAHHSLEDENELLNLYYTSGTTGRPKGVMLTHRNIYANALTTIISFGLQDSTVWYHIAPLFHLADAFFVWSVTFQGGRHVMIRQFNPAVVLQTIEKERITAAMMVPTMVNFLLNQPDIDRYDLSSLSWVMVGGAPMSPANAKRMMEKLGCRYVSGYGLTETSPLLTVGNLKETLRDAPEETRIESITRTGLEAIGVDLRVVGPDGQDVPWDGKSVGEILARGDNVMEGYWRLPEESAEALRDGYFRTGDLATVDPEGYLFIVDRAKDIIISGGENIASVEVENVLYSHPSVLECAVIAQPDEKWGEVPKAFICLRQEATVSEEEIIRYCSERLARFKVPKQIEFIPELPKTGSGKILKVELRRRLDRN